MTNESSIDSPRHESGVSPRRAARAARENAERTRSEAQPPAPEAAHGQSAAPDPALPERPSAAEAAKEAAELKAAAAAEDARVAAEDARIQAEGERTKALDAAQRARTQSAQRARKEAIEAQRAAAERVRQTLRANAAPLRDRSAAARSAVTPDTATAAPQAPDRNPVRPAANTPVDRDAPRAGNAGQAVSAVPDATPAQVSSPAGARSVPPAPSKPPVVKAAYAPAESAPETMDGTIGGGADSAATPSDALPGQAPTGHSPAPPATVRGHQPPAAADARATAVTNADEARHHGSEQLSTDLHEGPPAHPTEPHGSLERQNLFLTSTSSNLQARRARRRRRNWIVLAVLLGFCAVIFGIVISLQGLMDRVSPRDFPAPGGEAVTFEVKSGWGAQQIGRELESREIVASDKLFLEAIQLVETESREIHPGTYELRREMPALSAAEILIGEPAAKVSYVAIKQNTRMNQVLEEISTATGLSSIELGALAEDPEAFGLNPEIPNLEGYLHPGEYRFPLDVDATTVLKTLVDATLKTLGDNGVTDADQQYHVLQVASILQAEARQNDYGTVAGALENRLHPSNTETNGLLQVDSAVIYGLDRYTLQISEKEKKDAGNAYNTYVHKGLPPTPIGSPGDPAIKAAANPAPNDFYYWVTVDTNSGLTKFAKTYAEHRVNQNEFRAWCAANTDVCK
ncbi:endolytic transglycosylase MltG [Paeniglutamicibacter sp. ABSL32-1]|uniref:endolytic transglycosylase MltG n=1 Tax=Paeniglutamicibacter quisquiliarum TaxID=2849498 RepID=UPI001C2CF031|nr:endolytic transglycosylase MltG [Paeniglutamicibacter quisquiliarum]MBV1778419.1 endolytic transglycosylase MltG [Paeniglutamicibacter quisquiliarum]